MRHSAFVVAIGLLLAFPSSGRAQQQIVQDFEQEVTAVADPVEEQAATDTEDSLARLRQVEADFAMTGEDFKEIAIGPESNEAAAEGKVVISTTAIIIGLLVLILIT